MDAAFNGKQPDGVNRGEDESDFPDVPVYGGLFSFSGRSARSEFWLVTLATGTMSILFKMFVMENTPKGVAAIVCLVIGIVLFVLTSWVVLATQARRWHDRGKSGWMVLINFVPYLGWAWTLIELGFFKGVEGVNAYGYDPREEPDSAAIRKIKEDTSDEAPCMNCSAAIPAGKTACPECGWSYRS